MKIAYAGFSRTERRASAMPQAAGASERAVLIVDRGGCVAFRKAYVPDEVAPVEEVLTALEKI